MKNRLKWLILILYRIHLITFGIWYFNWVITNILCIFKLHVCQRNFFGNVLKMTIFKKNLIVDNNISNIKKTLNNFPLDPQILSNSLIIKIKMNYSGIRDLWLGTRTGAGGTATLTESSFFFWPQPRSPWTTGPP